MWKIYLGRVGLSLGIINWPGFLLSGATVIYQTLELCQTCYIHFYLEILQIIFFFVKMSSIFSYYFSKLHLLAKIQTCFKWKILSIWLIAAHWYFPITHVSLISFWASSMICFNQKGVKESGAVSVQGENFKTCQFVS